MPILESYRAELLKERERMAAIKRRYGLRSLEQMILESEAKLIEYETRHAKGENLPEVESLNEQRRKEELEMRKRALEEEIRRETSLLLSTPKILGVVRVLPQPTADQSMRSNAEIEAIGMHVAMQYEREHGRNPEDVSAENVGYDIRSTSPSGEVRYIELTSSPSFRPEIPTTLRVDCSMRSRLGGFLLPTARAVRSTGHLG
jgi:hypothetical protein